MSSSGQFIAPDETSDGDSSGYATGSEISTESLAPSVFQYRYENGRRYHAYKDGKYLAPNDEKEQDRLDITYHMVLLILKGRLHTAPIGENPQDILDIGTGTGIWAIDMGERYPSARVIGTDLSPIQPSWVPPNVEFQIDDAEAEWTWNVNKFDLVHIRHLSGAIKDWKRLAEQAFRAVKPGGWINIDEFDFQLFSDDDTFHKDLSMWKYYELVNKAAEKIGCPFRVAPILGPILEGAGFENVNVEVVKFPLGTWAADPKMKEIGAFFMLAAETGFEALGLAFLTRVLEMTTEDVMTLVAGIKKEMRSRKIHSYGNHYFFHAQKPVPKKAEKPIK